MAYVYYSKVLDIPADKVWDKDQIIKDDLLVNRLRTKA